MAAATGERAPAFSSEELEKLVDGVLPQYALLYGPPDQQVSAHQKIDIWCAIAKEVRNLGVYNRRGTHCRKRWEDIRCGTRKTAETLLGMASRPRRGASRTMTPQMSRILAVAYPNLDGRLRTAQQTQGASSGGGDLASEQEGAAGHQAPVGTDTDTEGTSDPEGEGSTTTGASGDTSDTDTSSFGSSLAVAAPSVPPATTGTAATQRTSTALPAAPQSSLRGRSARKAHVSFAPGTSAPASVTPAALSAELIDLVRTVIVGQTTLLNAISGVEREVHRSNAYLEGIHSGQAAHQRAFTALASALTAAIVPVSSLPLLSASTLSLSPVPQPIPSTPSDQPAHTSTPKASSSKHKHHRKHKHSPKQYTDADISTVTTTSVSPSSSSPSSLPVTSTLTPACTPTSASSSTTSKPSTTVRTPAVTTPTGIYTSPVSSPTVSVTPSSKTHKRRQTPKQQPTTSPQPTSQSPAPKDSTPGSHTTTSSSSTSLTTTPTPYLGPKKNYLSSFDLFPSPDPPPPTGKSPKGTSATTSPTSTVQVVHGMWSPPFGGSNTSVSQPPPRQEDPEIEGPP
ncbi:hypothetical protein NDU88_006917 [Pleurodeles waltl]|uniref:Myb/SANT-like DNA-binding domain-containing protein n=1 Tax=Pleurodeles waltl TaxID=8319 RepID=A0AAV7SRC0_PLEWA|nr:hypothetical protein NDU88_006917 [Pleurodeles waltl]